MLASDQVLQEAANTPAALNPFGTVFTALVWVLLILINLWCLRKLIKSDTREQISTKL
jgi:flagellar biogenesis protein FliO